MPLSVAALPCRRGSLRREVALECGVESALWDEEVSLLARDLSPWGMWLACPLPLEAGEALTLRFRPPRWPAQSGPLCVRAQVVRVALPRRRSERRDPGMGLRFVDLADSERSLLALSLRGLPPPLPCRTIARELPRGVTAEQSLVLPDGEVVCFRAEAPLLGAVRARRPRRGRPLRASSAQLRRASPSRCRRDWGVELKPPPVARLRRARLSIAS